MDLNASSTPIESPARPLASLLRQCRKEKGLSQAELAERLGLTWSTADVALLESSRIVIPGWIRLIALADALELPIETVIRSACARGTNDHCPECASQPAQTATSPIHSRTLKAEPSASPAHHEDADRVEAVW